MRPNSATIEFISSSQLIKSKPVQNQDIMTEEQLVLGLGNESSSQKTTRRALEGDDIVEQQLSPAFTAK